MGRGVTGHSGDGVQKRCNIKLLIKNNEFVYTNAAIDGIDEPRGAQQCRSKASATARHISKFLNNKPASIKDYVREVSGLRELYNDNLVRHKN